MLSAVPRRSGGRSTTASATATELVEARPSLGGVLAPVLGEASAQAAHGEFHPVLVGEVELTAGLRSFAPARAERARRQQLDPHTAPDWALVLVRLHGAPLGLVCLDLRVEEPQRAWPMAVLAQSAAELEAHALVDEGSSASLESLALWEGITLVARHCLEERHRAVADARPASVVIATRERVDALGRCLDSVLKLDYPAFEVIVVDNAPLSDATANFVAAKYGEQVRYVREDRKGLASAHNAALAVARGEILAFTDDDVLVDPEWLTELAVPFHGDGSVACATGLIVPAELETEAQLMLEAHGRFAKGFRPRTFDLGAHRPDGTLFPYAPGMLGSGANMAFDAAYLRRVGGFNAALGTGTKAMGGDDLAAFFSVIRAGRALSYRPGAVVWHHHRRDRDSVRRQAYGYGVGFGAYLASICVDYPDTAFRLAAHLPAAAAYSFTQTSGSTVGAGPLAQAVGAVPAWPRDLVRAQRLGILTGPYAYLRSVRAARRLERAAGQRPMRAGEPWPSAPTAGLSASAGGLSVGAGPAGTVVLGSDRAHPAGASGDLERNAG